MTLSLENYDKVILKEDIILNLKILVFVNFMTEYIFLCMRSCQQKIQYHNSIEDLIA